MIVASSVSGPKRHQTGRVRTLSEYRGHPVVLYFTTEYDSGDISRAFSAGADLGGPRGEHGCYVVSDGSNRPWRVHMRSPGLMACQALHKFIVGGMIADVIAVIGSLDVVMGDVDR